MGKPTCAGVSEEGNTGLGGGSIADYNSPESSL